MREPLRYRHLVLKVVRQLSLLGTYGLRAETYYLGGEYLLGLLRWQLILEVIPPPSAPVMIRGGHQVVQRHRPAHLGVLLRD